MRQQRQSHQTSAPAFTPAFTLVELLVVVGIIAILIGILLPVVAGVRRAVRVSNTQSFISQLSRAIDAYNSDFHDYPGPLRNEEVWSFHGGQGNFKFPDTTKFIGLFDFDKIGPGAGPNENDKVYYFPSTVTVFETQITMAENLVLGLLGGLWVDKANPASPVLKYDPNRCFYFAGTDALNSQGASKHYKSYLDPKREELSWHQMPDPANLNGPPLWTGEYKDESGNVADDTIIPEFVDQFLDPMPILYMRAKRGTSLSPPYNFINNNIVTYDVLDKARAGPYDIHQIVGYTGTKIGGGVLAPEKKNGKQNIWGYHWNKMPTHGLIASLDDPVNPIATSQNPPTAPLIYQYPWNAFIYFRNPALSAPSDTDALNYGNPSNARNDVPYQKDGYILISPGPDRIYGTADDITNFGPAAQAQ